MSLCEECPQVIQPFEGIRNLMMPNIPATFSRMSLQAVLAGIGENNKLCLPEPL